jgi:hypothetical protein
MRSGLMNMEIREIRGQCIIEIRGQCIISLREYGDSVGSVLLN